MSKVDKLRVPDYLDHIAQAIMRIARYTEDMHEIAFLADERTQDAVIRNLEIIGEACRNIKRHHPGLLSEHPEISWDSAYEMRNALSHGYFKVDLEIVWNTIQYDLPELEQQILRLWQQLKNRT